MQTDLFTSTAPERPPSARLILRGATEAWRRRGWPLLGSLKARLVLGGLLALWLSVAFTAWQMARTAERELLAQVDLREQQALQTTAQLLGSRMQFKQRALELAAASLDPATLADPERLARRLETLPVLRAAFSNLFVARPDGSVVLFVDGAGTRSVGINLSNRAYFQRTLAEERPVISEAVPGRISDEPVVVFTHPISDGVQVQAVLGGAIRLASHNLLQWLSEATPVEPSAVNSSADAALTVVADADGRLLTHPQRALLLQPLQAEPRLAPALPLARAARPSATIQPLWVVNGERVTMTVEPLSGWQVWRAVPQHTVLQPLQAAWRAALLPALLSALVLTAVLGGFLFWQLRPLAQLQARAQSLLQGDRALDEGWPQARGEIGQLSRTLRHVWAERAQVDAFNRDVLQRLSSVMAASPVGLAFTRHGHFELVSAELCALMHRSEDQLLGAPTQLIFASNEDYAALGPQVVAAFAAGVPYVGEWRLLRPDGSSFWARLRARPVDAGEPSAGTIWSLNDIGAQVQQREQLQRAAQHDALTGVLNRHGFEHSLQPLFARYQAQPTSAPPAALVMIDLDHFKPINDSAGHAAGDAMLVAVTRSIVAQVRASDVVARLGGDEFALLLPGCDQARGLAVAEKVREALTQLALRWEGQTLRIGASLGVASLGAGHASAADWLREADAACYAAKRSGRNGVCGQGAAPRAAAPGLRVVA